jgi:hypothetical protein
MTKITFKQRWREELEAISEEGILVFELTIGQNHVYFPDQDRWLAVVPAWAKDKWVIYLEACQNWCKENRIPISVVDDAHVQEEKPNFNG